MASMECSQSTIERRGSYYNTRYTQYQELAASVYTAMSVYKDIIDTYYTKLVSSSQHRPMSYWVLAEDDNDPAQLPLIDTDLLGSVVRMRQKLSTQEREISEREKRIREWHKLLSTTFQSKHEVDDDCSSNSSPPSYDIEAGLVKVHEYKTANNRLDHNGNRRAISIPRLGLAFLVTIFLVILLLSGVGVAMYFFGGFSEQDMTQRTNLTSSLDSTTIPTTVDILYTITSGRSAFPEDDRITTSTPSVATRKIAITRTSPPTQTLPDMTRTNPGDNTVHNYTTAELSNVYTATNPAPIKTTILKTDVSTTETQPVTNSLQTVNEVESESTTTKGSSSSTTKPPEDTTNLTEPPSTTMQEHTTTQANTPTSATLQTTITEAATPPDIIERRDFSTVAPSTNPETVEPTTRLRQEPTTINTETTASSAVDSSVMVDKTTPTTSSIPAETSHTTIPAEETNIMTTQMEEMRETEDLPNITETVSAMRTNDIPTS